MRCLLLCVLVTLMVVVSSAGTAPPGYQTRGRPRTIRGFKNVALSTARGFGKRAPLEADQEALGEPLPVGWFVEEIGSNPDLARLVVRKFIDANQDGLLTTSELLRPLIYSTEPQTSYK